MIKLCKKWGAIDFDLAMVNAAREGHIGMVKLCKEWGATEFDEAMRWAAKNGHIEIIKLCKEWGATEFNDAMWWAANYGHIEVVKLCKEWGATKFDSLMLFAKGHVEIVKLCREWLGFGLIHDEIFSLSHKRQFSRKICEELLPVAWHPDRVYDWCFDEEEKGFLEGMWKS